MKNEYKILVIIGLILAIFTVGYLLLRNNIKNNLSGKIDNFGIKNVRGLLDPMADVEITFTVTNNTLFEFRLKEFKVKIYNTITKEFLTENQVNKELIIPKGNSTHLVDLKDNKIIGNIEDFLSGNASYLAVVSFRYFGANIQFEQEVQF